jgi:hypothetical protein
MSIIVACKADCVVGESKKDTVLASYHSPFGYLLGSRRR